LIKLNFNGVLKKYDSCDEIVKKLKLSPMDIFDRAFIERLAAKDVTIHAVLNPYASLKYDNICLLLSDDGNCVRSQLDSVQRNLTRKDRREEDEA